MVAGASYMGALLATTTGVSLLTATTVVEGSGVGVASARIMGSGGGAAGTKTGAGVAAAV
jgi:hypothetical protein